jgi:hypothetical protein
MSVTESGNLDAILSLRNAKHMSVSTKICDEEL